MKGVRNPHQRERTKEGGTRKNEKGGRIPINHFLLYEVKTDGR